jgi:hypothetical protein
VAGMTGRTFSLAIRLRMAVLSRQIQPSMK